MGCYLGFLEDGSESLNDVVEIPDNSPDFDRSVRCFIQTVFSSFSFSFYYYLLLLFLLLLFLYLKIFDK